MRRIRFHPCLSIFSMIPFLFWSLAITPFCSLSACASAAKKGSSNSSYDKMAKEDQAEKEPWLWEKKGFLKTSSPKMLQLGPVQEDKDIFNFLEEIEKSKAWNDPRMIEHLESLLYRGSQIMANSVIYAFFRRGVFEGEPALIDLSCRLTAYITHSGLKLKNHQPSVEKACDIVKNRKIPKLDSAECEHTILLMFDAFDALSSGSEDKARNLFGEAMRKRIICSYTDAPPLHRSAIHPDSRGFLVLILFDALRIDSDLYFVGETSVPQLSKEVNQCFVQNVEQL